MKVKIAAEDWAWVRDACERFSAERLSTVSPPQNPNAKIIRPVNNYILLNLDHYFIIENEDSTQYVIYSHDTIEKFGRKYHLLIVIADYGDGYGVMSSALCSSNEVAIRCAPGDDDGIYSTGNIYDVITSLKNFTCYYTEGLDNGKHIIKERHENLAVGLQCGYDNKKDIVYARYSSNSNSAPPT